MSSKILINGKAGVGKTTLLKDLKDAFVVSRDGKVFPFEIPHMLIPTYPSMDVIINGGIRNEKGEKVEIEGIYKKLAKYKAKYKKLPKTIVIDSVSKIMQDAIDFANINFTGFDVHSSINKEIALLTNFIEEDLVRNNMNVVLINHVMDNEKKGLVPVGQGKFKDRGGFYAEVDYSILVTDKMTVVHRGTTNQARTLLHNIPDTQHVKNIIHAEKSVKLKEGEEFFSLQGYIDKIGSQNRKVVDDYAL